MNRGFTLIEIMITAVLIGAVSVGASASLAAFERAKRAAQLRELEVDLAAAISENQRAKLETDLLFIAGTPTEIIVSGLGRSSTPGESNCELFAGGDLSVQVTESTVTTDLPLTFSTDADGVVVRGCITRENRAMDANFSAPTAAHIEAADPLGAVFGSIDMQAEGFWSSSVNPTAPQGAAVLGARAVRVYANPLATADPVNAALVSATVDGVEVTTGADTSDCACDTCCAASRTTSGAAY